MQTEEVYVALLLSLQFDLMQKGNFKVSVCLTEQEYHIYFEVL